MNKDNDQLFLSIVVPCFHSGQRLEGLVERIEVTMKTTGRTFEVLLVNDASMDDTWSVIEHLVKQHRCVRGLDLLYNTGQFRATICGIEHSRGQYIATMDDDLQQMPEDLPKLIEAVECAADIDCVIGVFRQTQQNVVRRIGSQIVGYLNQYLYGKPQQLKLTSFRLMRRQIAEAICAHQTARPIIGPLLLQCTSRIANVQVQHQPRKQGHSGYTLRRLVGTVVDNVIAGSTLPLKAITLLGLVSATGSMLLGSFYLVKYLVGGIRVPGFATQVLLIIFFGGMMLLSIGILGEYVIRILNETSRAPRYRVRHQVDNCNEDSL